MPGTEIVENDRLAPRLREQFTSVTTNVARAAGDQNGTRQDVFTMAQSHRRTVLEAAQRL
jgi:hypothetical protein